MWAGDHDGAGREAHRHRRQICVVGGNAKAAKLSGIKTERLAFSDLREHGVLAALAGLVFAWRLNTATPKAGLGFELDVIAACFMGEPPPNVNPRSDSELEAKLRTAAAGWDPRYDVAPLVDAIRALDNSADVSRLASLAVPRAQADKRNPQQTGGQLTVIWDLAENSEGGFMLTMAPKAVGTDEKITNYR
jgi:Branched-chain amino acid transport system / permease component